MVGMGSVVTRDIPPFAKAFGNPARVRGVNVVGMTRMGHSSVSIEELALLYADLPLGVEQFTAFARAHPLAARAMDAWAATREGFSPRAADLTD
jgi:UDP-N-acetylglucosamine acyltransferase